MVEAFVFQKERDMVGLCHGAHVFFRKPLAGLRASSFDEGGGSWYPDDLANSSSYSFYAVFVFARDVKLRAG